jgi:hypothetical protein
LERSGADFVGSDGWIEIEKRFDAAAHGSLRKENSIAPDAARRGERAASELGRKD